MVLDLACCDESWFEYCVIGCWAGARLKNPMPPAAPEAAAGFDLTGESSLSQSSSASSATTLVKLFLLGPTLTGTDVESPPNNEFDDCWFRLPMPEPLLVFLAALKKLLLVLAWPIGAGFEPYGSAV